MSGSQLALLGGPFGPPPAYQIQRSLRFNSADSADLSRTPASASNRQIWTWSGWVKRSIISSRQGIFTVPVAGNLYWGLEFNSTDNITIYDSNAGGGTDVTTSAVYRDVSAWYHIVVAVDTTQATASNRTKLYVNGSQVTVFSAANYPTQNSNTYVNSTNTHRIGSWVSVSTLYFNGYMTEFYLIDGQALTPSSFGQTNSATGVWEPIAYTGTYGTNGFQLLFADNSGTTSTTLGKDTSGNGNNWTPNNFSVTAGAGNDSLVDTPTPYGTDTGAGGEVRGNYATLNPLKINTAANNQFSNGNLNYTVGAYDVSVVSTIGVSTGKWYWEVQWTQDGGFDRLGIVPEDASASDSPTNNGIVWNRLSTTNGMVMLGNNVSGSWGSAFSVNDIIMFALDCDNKALYIGQNGTWRNSGSPTSGSSKTGAVDYSSTSLNGKTLFPVFGKGNAGTTSYIANFGQRPFAYTAPSGFNALCTQNLPTPTVGATSATQAGKYFNTVLWTGNGASPRSITGVGFQPDFVWIKNRSDAYFHTLYDAVRGVGSRAVYSSSTDEENGGSSNYSSLYGYLSSFDSDGFGLTSGTDDIWTNDNTKNYVAWNWKANGAGSTNTAGTITATVSANTTSGISVVTYSISSASSTISTFGHGLGVAPSMVLLKVRNAVDGWTVYHSSISNPNSNWLVLNTTAAAGGNTSTFSQSSTTFGVRETRLVGSGGSGNVIAYCFAPIAGYSAFGSYVGNGVGFVGYDGPFVYTGFRPRYVLIKVASGSTDMGAGKWCIYDAVRNPYNVTNLILYANLSDAEGNGSPYLDIDILSNGFKIRGGNFGEINGNGNTYIYAAFAENPFKYSLAR